MHHQTEQRDCGNGGFGQGEEDSGEDGPLVGSIQFCRFFQGGWYATEEVKHQDAVIGLNSVGQDQRPDGIDTSMFKRKRRQLVTMHQIQYSTSKVSLQGFLANFKIVMVIYHLNNMWPPYPFRIIVASNANLLSFAKACW